MAMLNEALRTPDWLRVEITYDVRTLEYRLDIGVKCKDGWAHLVSMEVPVGSSTSGGADLSKARAYDLAHEFITRKLAIETLENT